MEASLNTDPAVIALEPTKNQLRAFAAGLVIRSHEGYEQAALQLKTIKSALADIEAARVRITGPLNWALKETNNQAKAASLPFAQDEQTIKVAMVTYSNEQDRLRQEEQRRQNEASARQRARSWIRASRSCGRIGPFTAAGRFSSMARKIARWKTTSLTKLAAMPFLSTITTAAS